MEKYIVIEDPGGESAECGIALCRRGVTVKAIPCVAPREDAEMIAALLNELKIEPCHFEDVIEDYLTDFCV